MCLDLNASILGTMPPYLVGASPTLDAGWLTNPDPDKYTSWADFAKQLFWDYQLGEVFVIATAYYATGKPARFHVVEPWGVDVEWDGGTRRYAIGGRDVTADMLHVRYRTRTGDPHGQGPLDAGRTRLIAAEVLSRYATNLVASGGIPPSVLEHPDELSAEQSAALREQWVIARSAAIGYPAVLSGGVTWKATSISPTDMALVELTQITESRIAALLGVPPFLVGLPSGGDSMTYSNVSSLFDYHWRAGLRPKAETVCKAVSGWALPAGTTFEVNRDEYVRPDPYTRAQTWQLLISAGVLTAEQVATIERYNVGAPLPQGATISE
jgi:HK97 family phage portal protein